MQVLVRGDQILREHEAIRQFILNVRGQAVRQFEMAVGHSGTWNTGDREMLSNVHFNLLNHILALRDGLRDHIERERALLNTSMPDGRDLISIENEQQDIIGSIAGIIETMGKTERLDLANVYQTRLETKVILDMVDATFDRIEQYIRHEDTVLKQALLPA